MRRTFRLALMLGVLIACPVVTAQAAEPDLEGMYTAEGRNPDGSEYRAAVKIVRRGESFQVAWMFPEGGGEEIAFVLRSAGVGVAHGGMLAVSYYGQNLTGIILYQVENGGKRLTGRWVVTGGDGRVHSETLTRLPPTPEKPTFTEPVYENSKLSIRPASDLGRRNQVRRLRGDVPW